MAPEIQPLFHLAAFNCPNCGVLAPQKWFEISQPNILAQRIVGEMVNENRLNGPSAYVNGEPVMISKPWHLEISICSHCERYVIWENKKMIYPFKTELPEPHKDMHENVKKIYEEAMLVYKHSPRAAAALLRLAIETMIPQLDGYNIKKAKINTMIGELVKKDIPTHIQQGLDAIRVYGNEGIHSGEINLNEDPETVMFLFDLINIMVEELITRKSQIKSFYAKLPIDKIKGIINRDKTSR
ncbi:DUF4145 domain-containing protein [Bacillus haynesii]|uniref:DUF4145 domain-containing protein n=2 Tax=Bacillus haynesii TaxID=1925021 RepID=UPI00227FF4C7|nr:DUF4145 domain-containing protein [Bacillus haynesii]MCY7770670.1 DUF4145 domain-containing protein [Bacillus haynesii]MCY8001437.1 DUF4145 domain-containing protein [Bacillus haynesii]MCY8012195.1 DUF4145 domain-containing protein [Bacillus haynesii]MCY8101385.1 DUF4145 domain-containing protein [Bacillus haynesii]MCY8350583.1 DUF4145 domain-containing protein [Bacillus haynesii]